MIPDPYLYAEIGMQMKGHKMTRVKNPEVSIIITNYNYGKFLPRCMRSCLDQNGIEHEVIVVDDCSTDESCEAMEPFLQDPRVLFIRNEENVGVAEASNIGLRAARGSFVIRVDADDYVSANMSLFLREYLMYNKDVFCVSCDYLMVDTYGNPMERKYAAEENISCGIMYRRELLLQMGGYNAKMRHREEEELRKRLGALYKIEHLKIPMYRYRMHNHNKTKEPEYETWEI
jgi:glycosyltransferase involved in cell wall biosynthesis